ncbi:MAG: hypothetical protein IKE17_14405, partial [Clostridia bacterium]|nr:hypothetical protein [Clostridia bacterium]
MSAILQMGIGINQKPKMPKNSCAKKNRTALLADMTEDTTRRESDSMERTSRFMTISTFPLCLIRIITRFDGMSIAYYFGNTLNFDGAGCFLGKILIYRADATSVAAAICRHHLTTPLKCHGGKLPPLRYRRIQGHCAANSDLSRACARLKGDRSPFNTSSSDLPEIAGDFRAANLQGSLFCSG